MSYTFSFADNVAYKAADVNKITSRLVTSGVADPFTDGTPYNLSKFNEIGQLLYTEGVVPETVHTLKVVKAENEGQIQIYPGTAFFADGSAIEIDAGGATLNYAQGARNYVYLKNGLKDYNECYPACETTYPTGDYVMLAEISASGVITDRRTYAKGKLPGYASNSGYVMNITETIKPTSLQETIRKTYSIGNNTYNYLLLFLKPCSSSDGYGCLGLYNMSDGSYFSFAGNRIGIDASYKCFMTDNHLYLFESNGASASASVSFNSNTLSLDISYYADHESYLNSFTIELYLF